jgi:hypothetical protein
MQDAAASAHPSSCLACTRKHQTRQRGESVYWQQAQSSTKHQGKLPESMMRLCQHIPVAAQWLHTKAPKQLQGNGRESESMCWQQEHSSSRCNTALELCPRSRVQRHQHNKVAAQPAHTVAEPDIQISKLKRVTDRCRADGVHKEAPRTLQETTCTAIPGGSC